MPKAKVNEELCIGCGACHEMCPGVFEIKEDGKSHVIAEECGDCDCQGTADQCPVSAITVE